MAVTRFKPEDRKEGSGQKDYSTLRASTGVTFYVTDKDQVEYRRVTNNPTGDLKLLPCPWGTGYYRFIELSDAQAREFSKIKLNLEAKLPKK